MKTKLLSIIALVSVFFLASCEKDGEQVEKKQLNAPVISEVTEQTGSSFTISWNAVENATYYKYVLNEGQPDQIKSFTSDLFASFTGLEEGTYEFKVCAAGDENTTLESPYSSYNVTITRTPDFTFIIEDVEATTATIGVIPAETVGSYFYDITDARYIEELGGEEAFVEYMVNLLFDFCEQYNVTMDQLLTVGQETYGYTELTPNNLYIVYAFGFTPDGEVTTGLYYEEFTTKELNVEPSEHLVPFLGTWNATFDKTAQWSEGSDGKYYPGITNEPWTTTITIQHHATSGYDNVAVVFGWSALGEEYYAIGSIDETHRLVFYNEEIIGPENSQGYVPAWMAIANITSPSGETQVGLAGTGQFPVYMLSAENGTITSRRYIDESEDGSTYEMIGYEIYAISSAGFSLYHTNPMSAGDLTLTPAAPTASLTKFKSAQMMEHLKPLSRFENFVIPTFSVVR